MLDLNLDPDNPPAHYPIYDASGGGGGGGGNGGGANTDTSSTNKDSSTHDATSAKSKFSIPITFHACDITSLPALTALLDELRPDVVFHTASPHADAPAAVLERVNVQGTANVIEACRAARLDGREGASEGKLPRRARALVYTSSASVVFDARRKHPAGLVNADERWPVVTGKAQSEFYTDTKVSIRCFPTLRLHSVRCGCGDYIRTVIL